MSHFIILYAHSHQTLGVTTHITTYNLSSHSVKMWSLHFKYYLTICYWFKIIQHLLFELNQAFSTNTEPGLALSVAWSSPHIDRQLGSGLSCTQDPLSLSLWLWLHLHQQSLLVHMFVFSSPPSVWPSLPPTSMLANPLVWRYPALLTNSHNKNLGFVMCMSVFFEAVVIINNLLVLQWQVYRHQGLRGISLQLQIYHSEFSSTMSTKDMSNLFIHKMKWTLEICQNLRMCWLTGFLI